MGEWHLSAHGAAQDEDAERELAATLAAVLADPRFGTAGSQFASAAHNGPVHRHARKRHPGKK